MAHLRIGIDTGGTFTDVVAVDTRTGTVMSTKTPSTPADPADGFLAGIDKILDLIGAAPAEVSAVLHGTTVATNQLLQGKVGSLGFITTTGYGSMLEIARQSVPDGYGNSYFWVKPDRIVPADLVRTVGGRLDFRGNEIRPFDHESAVAAVRFFRDNDIRCMAVCFLHSYANGEHEQLMAEVIRSEYPGGGVLAVQRRAPGIPRVRARDDHTDRRRCQTDGGVICLGYRPAARAARRRSTDPVLDHAVERRGALRGTGGPSTDQHRAVRSGGRRIGCRDDRRPGGLPIRADL